MGKIIRVLCNIIFVILIIVLACYFILRNMGIVEIYKVETGSMEHGIHVGDYVLISKKNKYVVGDIVTYQKDNYFITHRIIKSIDGDKVITKGDANNTEDEEISMSAIVGKVIFIGGILNIIVDYKYGIVSLFLAIYLLTCYYGVNDNSKNKDEKEKESKNNDADNQKDKKETVETVTLKDGTELELIPEDKQTKNEEKGKKEAEESTSEETNNLKEENKEDNNKKKENDKKESDTNNKDNKNTLDKKVEESTGDKEETNNLDKEKNKLI